MDWKKFWICFGIIVLGIILYFLALMPIPLIQNSGLHITILFPLFIIAHIIISIFYVRRYSKRILVILVALLLVHVFITQFEFPSCDRSGKSAQFTECDCLGVKKITLFSSQCVGVRTNCYEFNQTVAHNKTLYELDPNSIKYEVQCK